MKFNRKGQLSGVGNLVFALAGIGLAMVLTGLILAFGLNIQDSVDDGFTANSYEANASTNFLSGSQNLSSQAPNIGLVAGAIVIIALLVVGFGGLIRRGN